jgi:hypothetical protein
VGLWFFVSDLRKCVVALWCYALPQVSLGLVL